jgi:hypothetical protein
MTEPEVPTDSPLRVRMRPDWGIGPVWIAEPGDGFEGYDLEEAAEVLGLSSELQAAIEAWDSRFQATLDQDNPQHSGAFPTQEDEMAFVAEGRELARRVQVEAPGAVVLYETVDGQVVPLDDVDNSAP